MYVSRRSSKGLAEPVHNGFPSLCAVLLQPAAVPVPGMRVASTLAELSLVSSTSVRCAIREKRPFEDDVPVSGPWNHCLIMQRDQAP
jgi:hypothetical protein